MEIMIFIIIILCVLGKIEQYSQDPRDLGTMVLEEYDGVKSALESAD